MISAIVVLASFADAGRVRRDPQYSVFMAPHIQAQHQAQHLHNTISNYAYSLQNQITAAALNPYGNQYASYQYIRPIGSGGNYVYATNNGGGVIATASAYRPGGQQSFYSSGASSSSGYRPGGGNRPVSGFSSTGNRPVSGFSSTGNRRPGSGAGWTSTAIRPNGISASAVAVSNSG